MTEFASIRSGASALPEESVAHRDHDDIYQSGVIDYLGTHLKVSEHNPQNMSVDIAVGRGYFKKTAMTYHGYMDAVKTLTIGANSSGNPRIDAVIAYIDVGASPNSDASNVFKIVVVAGTPAGSPVAPDDTAVQSSIGAGNPFVRLANVAVANGASSIVNANITDTRVSAYVKYLQGITDTELIRPRMGGGYQKVKAYSGSGAIALDCANYNVFELTMTGDMTLSFTSMNVGQFIQIDQIQDSTGGRTITWPATIKWEDGVEPVSAEVLSTVDGYVIKKIGTNLYRGSVIYTNMPV